ncbi:MAG: hypothetical protein A2Z25_00780 [Planctomycetes bacterium RBG_16_55_9]|nr:MAG: hypothetical protein A2Z25_00780 [Planctomycetes bacterium RBG_16_55_9]
MQETDPKAPYNKTIKKVYLKSGNSSGSYLRVIGQQDDPGQPNPVLIPTRRRVRESIQSIVHYNITKCSIGSLLSPPPITSHTGLAGQFHFRM